MIERDHPDLSIGQPCALLSIPRSSFYYSPRGGTEQNLALNEAIYRFGPPDIMNSDQGSQLISFALDRPPTSVGHPHLDGRQGTLSGQHLN